MQREDGRSDPAAGVRDQQCSPHLVQGGTGLKRYRTSAVRGSSQQGRRVTDGVWQSNGNLSSQGKLTGSRGIMTQRHAAGAARAAT